MNKRLFIVFILGFSSGLPMALVSSTLQAWFASSGMSVMATGALSLISLPYVYRMLWAPFVDHYSLFKLGKRRSWMLFAQIALLIGFNVLAFGQPLQHPNWMAFLAVVLAFCSATQDIVIDAHRTEYLPVKEHGIGASLAVFGYRLAIIISGGLALILAQYYGWSVTYRLMGLLMIPGMLATMFSPEPSIETNNTPARLCDTYTLPIKELIARPQIFLILFFIFFYKLGEAFTSSTSGVMMSFLIQGLGFSLDTVGFVNKVVGMVSLLLGGLFSGIILLRWSIYRALLSFGFLQAITNLLFVALAIQGNNLLLFSLAVISDNLAAGLGTTALLAFIMRIVDKRYTATQFSIFVSIASLPRVLSGPVSALIQSSFGWVGLFQLSFFFALGFIPFLGVARREIQRCPVSECELRFSNKSTINNIGSNRSL
jgi:PAT family beta-lactamase induction signal transducer AmpG